MNKITHKPTPFEQHSFSCRSKRDAALVMRIRGPSSPFVLEDHTHLPSLPCDSTSFARSYHTIDKAEGGCDLKERSVATNKESTAGKTLTRPGRVVSFDPNLQVVEVVRTLDLVDDPSELWFERDEYQRIMKKIMVIVRTLENDPNYHKKCMAVGRRLCTRGLERFLATTRRVITGRRTEALRSVLEAQNHLRGAALLSGTPMKNDEQQDFCNNLIASVYTDCSEPAVVEALERAKADSLENEVHWTGGETSRMATMVNHTSKGFLNDDTINRVRSRVQ